MAKDSLSGSPMRGGTGSVLVGAADKQSLSPPNQKAPPPREPQPLTPTQRLKNLMNHDSWMITQSFVQWGEMWQNLEQGALTPYNEDSRMVMMAPFTYFNASPQLVSVLFGRVVPHFLGQYGQYMTDEIFRQTNPMPWLVLQSFAPQFAMQDNGLNAQVEAWEIIRELKNANQLPLEESGKHGQPGGQQVPDQRHVGPGNIGRTG